MFGGEWSATHLNYGDFVSTSHWRLADIQVSRYFEKADKQEDTTDSNLSPIDTYILLVPPHLIGNHEGTIGDPLNPTYVSPGYDRSGFAEIDLSTGWGGPALAVAAQTPEIYKNFDNILIHNGRLGLISELDYGTLVTLDGHHRLEMAIALRWKYIPIQLIPFPQHKSVILKTWNDDGYIWSPDTVIECGQVPNWKAPPKRTKFQMIGKDGIARRIRHLQPYVHIPLKNLM